MGFNKELSIPQLCLVAHIDSFCFPYPMIPQSGHLLLDTLIKHIGFMSLTLSGPLEVDKGRNKSDGYTIHTDKIKAREIVDWSVTTFKTVQNHCHIMVNMHRFASLYDRYSCLNSFRNVAHLQTPCRSFHGGFY